MTKGPGRSCHNTSYASAAREEALFAPSIGGGGLPERQHAVHRQAVHRLADTGLLDLARDVGQADRIEGNGGDRPQESQVAKARRQLADLRSQTGREQRYPALSQSGIYGSAGRDKQGATL